MILSVSNIAWAPRDRLAAYDVIARAGIVGLEIAPGLFFASAEDPFVPDATCADAAMREIASLGLSLVSMQSLLFGVEGAALFGDSVASAMFERGMTRAINLAGQFGIPNLVFGSPAQRRIPDDMSEEDAWGRAAETFCRLGDLAAAEGTRIAIEANPASYGTNFLTTLDEAEAFVAYVGHSAVTLILDLELARIGGTGPGANIPRC